MKATQQLLRGLALLLAGLLALAVLSPPAAAQAVQLGIDVLKASGFRGLQGKRIGLLTHRAGVDQHGKRTIDVLHQAPGVQLAVLFCPEHGLASTQKAEKAIDDGHDPTTGLPIHSLYGKRLKVCSEVMQGLDALVVDLQDIGVRSYTYIACLKMAMETAFDHGVPVIILDRPNPLGGRVVAGPMLEADQFSYVGPYPIPYVYGLTLGELALMAKDRGWLKLKKPGSGQLQVIAMKGWKRHMLWPDTGLKWVATSPKIPSVAAAFGYSMVGLGAQLGGFKHGMDTEHPFRVLSFPGKSADEVLQALQQKRLPGLSFRKIKMKTLAGAHETRVYVNIDSWEQTQPTAISLYMMQLACAWQSQNPFLQASSAQAKLFNHHTGCKALYEKLCQHGKAIDAEGYLRQWEREAQAFSQLSKPYYLYGN
jgi:uncharacterized protein YbbC (DUF1343 family)